MTRKERLLATLQGRKVDRPAVSFYEIGSFKYDSDNPDKFNVHNHPSWRPLLQMAEERTDIIRLIGQKPRTQSEAGADEFITVEKWDEGDSRYTRSTLTVCGRKMTELTRRDADTDTLWKLEHYIKNIDDLKAFLELPFEIFAYEYDCRRLEAFDNELGDAGIAAFDTADPLCLAADLFSMADYTIFAMTEPELFRRLLDKFAAVIYPAVEKAASRCPGRLWRIYGPEYASEPYLPPMLFDEYVVKYDEFIVRAIQKSGGFARIHSHGRLKNILPLIAKMGADALDPVEPPIQGDVELEYVRQKYGEQMVLFGNLEITDIENLAPAEFEKKIRTALTQGTAGEGRGFVLMPSASPYGRLISENVFKNYKMMLDMAENFS